MGGFGINSKQLYNFTRDIISSLFSAFQYFTWYFEMAYFTNELENVPVKIPKDYLLEQGATFKYTSENVAGKGYQHEPSELTLEGCNCTVLSCGPGCTCIQFYNPWTLSDDRFDRHFRRSSVPTFLLLDTFDGKEMRQHKNDALKKKKAACCPRTEEGKFHVGLNLSNFKPDEIDVSLDEDRLKIHAKSETASSEVFKWYSLPENIETDKLTSSLSRDGTLHVIAPFKTITNEPESITSDAKSAKISTESDSMENADKKEDEPSQSEMPPANPPEQDAVAMTTSQNQEPETDSKSGFHVELPMKRFKPEHVNVSIEEHKLKVHAKKIEESDGHFLHEEFTKWFNLPSDADVNQLRSNLQDNGVLVINAPLCATTNALTSPNEESTHNGADDTEEKEVIADGDDADHAQTE